MRGQINKAIARLANRRKGLVQREELRDIGLSERQIDLRLESGFLIPEHEAVYRVGHCAPNLECSYLAAVLACGEGALLCGRAAAYLYGLIKGGSPRPEVTTSTQRRPKAVVTHRRQVHPRDATVYRGIPITTVPRTVVDMAAESTSAELALTFHQAVVRFHVKPRDVERVLKRRPNSKGAKTLRRVILGDERALLSELERGFIALLRKENLPLPRTNIPKDGHWVDCRWPEHDLTIELDSYRYHGTRHAWEQDHTRERKARERGDRYRRYVYSDVFEAAAETADDVRQLLSTPPS